VIRDAGSDFESKRAAHRRTFLLRTRTSFFQVCSFSALLRNLEKYVINSERMKTHSLHEHLSKGHHCTNFSLAVRIGACQH